ncbi:MAG: phosphomannomutase/phosphoglucomutase [bacterium]|nr:phosphomannomutase/phosphoglucomutase [bacterium]
MEVASNIYKAYDIRGIYGSELTEEVTYKTARAYAQLLKKENAGKLLTVAVGEDMRLSSPSLKDQVIAGLTDEGLHVMHVGIVSTPAFYYAVAKYAYDGGIMVTASHNPKEFNGLKFVRAGVKPVSMENGIAEIRDTVIADNFAAPTAGGNVEEQSGIVEEHTKFEVDWVGTEGIRPFKIVADCANAMGSTYVRAMFSHLPCELIEMNFELDGNMPAHEADPFKEENNQDLMKRVVEEGADLGIATDGDGDRIFFIDNEGNMIEPAIIRGLVAKLVLEREPNSTICYDIRPGRITRDMIEAAGGKPSVTKVGHSFIKDQAIKEGAAFAGESSGHFFMRTELGVFETPVIVAMMLLKFFSRKEESVADQVRPYRKYAHSGEINSAVKDKEGIMNKLLEIYEADAKSISKLDGITVEYEDYWFNVRPSNTESVLRLNLESINEETMRAKTDEILAIIRKDS